MHILFFALAFLPPSFAQSNSLPAVVVASQELLVAQGICEARWEEIASAVGIEKHAVGAGTEILLVPCANWAGNLAWSIYAKIDEASRADGAIVKPQFFLTYNRFQKLMANNVIYNISWNDEEETLVAEYHASLQAECGSRALYKWNQSQQAFVVQKLLKKDSCRPEGSWETLIDQTEKQLSQR